MTTTLTCDRADQLLADWLDGTLDAATAREVSQHVAACTRCGAQLAALESPMPEAAALPTLMPSRDLWAGIEERIATPVVSLSPAVGTVSAIPRSAVASAAVTPRRFGWVAQAAAAAALVTVTAGSTWMYAARFFHDSAAVVAETARTSSVRVRHNIDDARGPASSRADARSGARAVSTEQALSSVERTYDREVGALRAILTERRAELDPATLAVLERNLRVIDKAIAESREAIARNPSNTILGDQLAVTLDKKLQLLRTAALLPPRA